MGPSETADSLQGRCLAGRYRLIEVIGSGGAGNVWAAVDEVLERRVAVKDVGAPPWLSVESWQALRERTLREARAAAAIGHPNVVTVYDVVEEDDRPWIVMQLVEAPTLSQLIDEQGPCPPRRVAEIGLQVLAALEAAHAHGILHRDVKPSNVLVGDDGHAVLTDFGIATVDGDVALTASGVLVGAPAYIAPERVQGGAAGPASDLWSLGATLYTAVEGRPPYRRDGAICTIAAVVHEDPDPMEQAGVLAPVITALLRRDPEQRPSAAQVDAFLRRILSTAPGPDADLSAELAEADVAPLPTRAAAITTAITTATGPNTGPNAGAGTNPHSRHTRAYAASDDARTRHTPAYGVGGAGVDAADGVGGVGAEATAPTVLPRDRDAREPRRLRMAALLAAAATALFAIMMAGYLARHTLEPASPMHHPSDNQSVNPEQVADVQVGSSVPATGGSRRAPGAGGPVAPSTEATTQPSSTAIEQPPPTSDQPPTASNPTSATQEPTTTADPTTTTESEPTATGGGAGPSSVLP